MHVATRELIQQIDRRCPGFDQVFTGLDGAGLSFVACVKLKETGAADRAGIGESVADGSE